MISVLLISELILLLISILLISGLSLLIGLLSVDYPIYINVILSTRPPTTYDDKLKILNEWVSEKHN